MYSYGYKVPGLQDQIARQRQTQPRGVEPDAPVGVVVPTGAAPISSASVDDSVPLAPNPVPLVATPAPRAPAQEQSMSPRAFFESQILPEVRAVLGDTGVYSAYNQNRDRVREESYSNSLNQSERENFERLRGTPVPSPVRFPETISLRGLGRLEEQPGITGLFNQLVNTNEEINQLRTPKITESFGNLLTKYPELNSVFYTEPDERNRASRVRESGFTPYLDYVDKKQVFSAPEARAELYNKILASKDNILGSSFETSELGETLKAIESDYISGDTQKQFEARQLLETLLGDPEELNRIETPAYRESRPVIGGGRYVEVKDNPLVKKINQRAKAFNEMYGQLDETDKQNLARVYPGLSTISNWNGEQTGFYLDPYTREVTPADFDDPEAYGVEVKRYIPRDISLTDINNSDFFSGQKISENALRFLADYPLTSNTDISFTTREPGYSQAGYSTKLLPPEIVNPVASFVSDTAFRGLRPGTLVTNSPLSSDDLVDKRIEEGKTAAESSTLRRLQPFIDKGSQLPNLRGLAYTSAGFGPVTASKMQTSYVDDKGQAIPIQLERTEAPLRGVVAVRTDADSPKASVFQPALPASATPRYYSADPISGAVLGGKEFLSNLRRTPSALLPGVADLIPSPEAVRTGYTKGPVEMGKQMAQEFAQSLPSAAGAAMLLATPVAAPLAPGIGIGMVGTAGTRALNEVIRQETGEGILPKLRQFLGTAPRTGVAAPARQGKKPLVAEIKPLTAAGKQQMYKNQTRNEMQRRLDLAKERFNPSKGELGITELLFGR